MRFAGCPVVIINVRVEGHTQSTGMSTEQCDCYLLNAEPELT